jgi:hypothetical protein
LAIGALNSVASHQKSHQTKLGLIAEFREVKSKSPDSPCEGFEAFQRIQLALWVMAGWGRPFDVAALRAIVAEIDQMISEARQLRSNLMEQIEELSKEPQQP